MVLLDTGGIAAVASVCGGVGLIFLFIVLPVLCCLPGCLNLANLREMSAEDAALAMYEYWKNHKDGASDIPDTMKGVFWMSDNPAPELLTTLAGSKFYPGNRVITTPLGRVAYGWSYCSHWKGWLEAWMVTLMSFGTYLRWEWNEGYTEATMPLYIFGLFRFYSGFTIKIKDPDGAVWDRITYKWDGKTVNQYASYTLKKVIDKDGNKLPAFDEMVAALESGVGPKGATPKTKVQLVPGPSKCCPCRRQTEVRPFHGDAAGA